MATVVPLQRCCWPTVTGWECSLLRIRCRGNLTEDTKTMDEEKRKEQTLRMRTYVRSSCEKDWPKLRMAWRLRPLIFSFRASNCGGTERLCCAIFDRFERRGTHRWPPSVCWICWNLTSSRKKSNGYRLFSSDDISLNADDVLKRRSVGIQTDGRRHLRSISEFWRRINNTLNGDAIEPRAICLYRCCQWLNECSLNFFKNNSILFDYESGIFDAAWVQIRPSGKETFRMFGKVMQTRDQQKLLGGSTNGPKLGAECSIREEIVIKVQVGAT